MSAPTTGHLRFQPLDSADGLREKAAETDIPLANCIFGASDEAKKPIELTEHALQRDARASAIMGSYPAGLEGALFMHDDLERTRDARPIDAASVRIRLATADDADGIRSVYAPFIETPVTFEEEVPAVREYRKRIAGVCEKFPCLVAEKDGEIIGYAYAHELRERIAFQWNAELSVYLAPRAQGRRLGTILYATLIELLRDMGIKAVYGVVTSPNLASEHLHEAFGFALMGTQPHAGFTCGAWHDVNWFVREIAPFEDDPVAPVPFPEFARENPERVEEALRRASEKLED